MKNQGMLERRQVRVIELVTAGLSDEQVALALSTKRASVSAPAVTQFRARHAEQLAAINQEAERRAVEYAIANQVNRVATNDALKNLLLQVKDARASGKTGIETGLVVMRERALGSGDGMVIVREYEIDPALITLIDRLHNSTADELGQKVKPDQNINLRAQVLVREYVGIDPGKIG